MKTTTITREYDDEGRVIRETRIEVERPEPPYRWDEGRWWMPDPNPWWRNPVIYTVSTTPNTSAPVLINGGSRG